MREKSESSKSHSPSDRRKELEPYDLFIFAINAEQIKEKYVTRMKKYLKIIGID
jgi:hypothetical protein